MTGNGASRLLKIVAELPAMVPEGPGRDRMRALVDRMTGHFPTEVAPSAGEFPSAEMDALPWKQFREGVEILPLSENEGGAAALLRYRPHATVPHHTHSGEEHILVLAGSQSDERGDYPAGTVTMNSVGSSHSVASPDGCLVAILWEKPVIFSVNEKITA